MRLLREVERLGRAPSEVPALRDPSHVLLTSYPKSGNTWLRFMLGNLSRILGDHAIEVDFHTLGRYVPEIRGNRRLEGRIETPGFPLFLKSHFPRIRGFSGYRTVVLVRAPADTLVSHYHHLTEVAGLRFPGPGSFVRHWRYGAPAWTDWYGSWQGRHDVLVRYEDLLEDPEAELRSLVEALGLEISPRVIAEAVACSSRDTMRRLQAERGDPNLRNPSFQFVNRARSGAGRETLEEADLAYVREVTDPVARDYGYQSDDPDNSR